MADMTIDRVRKFKDNATGAYVASLGATPIRLHMIETFGVASFSCPEALGSVSMLIITGCGRAP